MTLALAPNVVWRPQPGPQTELLRCPTFEVFYGGARGGGKTDGMLGEWAQHAQMHGQHAVGKFFRRDRTELEQAIERARTLYTPLGATWKEVDKTFVFPDGARLGFAYLDRDADADKYQGHSYTRIYIEEIGTFPDPKPIMKLRATLRSAHGVPCRFRATGNPGGVGHAWVKDRYIDPAPLGWRIIEEHGLERVYIPSKLRDNPKLTENDPTYVNRLSTAGSAELVRAWLEGDWDIVEGAFFDEWSLGRHVVKPVELPKHWTRFTSFDWGSARPFAVCWWAVSDGELPQFPRGALVMYREWYGSSSPNVGLKMQSSEIARGILRREGKDENGKPLTPMFSDPIKYRVADPACWKVEDGPSIAEKMSQAHVNMIPADNSRITGWEQLRARLKGEDDRPMIYFFSTCPHLIRTLPSMQHDEHKPEDIDSDAEDHCVDSVRYAAMSRPWTAAKPAAPEARKRYAPKSAPRRSGWAA
jgi:hypothetical protein